MVKNLLRMRTVYVDEKWTRAELTKKQEAVSFDTASGILRKIGENYSLKIGFKYHVLVYPIFRSSIFVINLKSNFHR